MNYRTVRTLIAIISVLLFVQYGLGIVVNLFAVIPPDIPLAFFSYSAGIEVLAHIVNGSLILIIAVGIVAISATLSNHLLPRLALLALIFVAAAVATGLIFTLQGQNPAFSIAMAMSFISAYTVYFGAYFVSGPIMTSESRTANS